MGPQGAGRAQARPQSIPRPPARPPARPPPPPPARPNAPVGGAAHQCPGRPTTPCDPVRLVVQSTYPTTDPRRLTAAGRLRGNPVPRNTDPEIRRLLGAYDLLIDTVAGYPSSEPDNPSQPVTLDVSTQMVGSCCFGTHPRLVAQPNPGPEQTYIRNALRMGPLRYHARPSTFDTQGLRGILGFWAFLALFLPGRDEKHVLVRAQGCGRRPPNAGAPVTELNALVRIFRAGEWKISLTVPATDRVSRVRGSASQRAVAAEESRGWTVTDYRQHLRTRLDLKIERNGFELPGAQRVTRILEFITQFRETMKSLLSAMERCPQFGWRFVGKFSVLEGTIDLTWGPEMLNTPEVNGRYLPVRTKMGIKARLKLVDIELELSFGLLARNETTNSQIEARIIGTLRFWVAIRADLPMMGRREPIQVPVESRGSLEARARANATVAGATILNGTVAVSGAIRVDSGMVGFGWNGIRTQGVVYAEAVKIEAEIQVGPFPPWKKELTLMEQREITRFTRG